MEIAPEFGGGHGGGGHFLGMKPSFDYEEVKGVFRTRRHYLHVFWINERGHRAYSASSFAAWNEIRLMCDELFPTWYLLNFKYHVDDHNSRIEFYRKSDAMLFKLKYSG